MNVANTSRWLALILVMLLAACVSGGAVEPSPPLVPLPEAIATANTRADHEALASRFEQEADSLQALHMPRSWRSTADDLLITTAGVQRRIVRLPNCIARWRSSFRLSCASA